MISDRLRRIRIGSAVPDGPVEAVWNGAVIARSANTVVLEGNHYFPPEAINHEFLDQSVQHTVCPWKGRASYYDVVVGGQRNAAAAWYYPRPSSERASG
ncbi:MAG: DUF427 domain-containing protein [Solirubrobacteraceae bacterium]